MQLIYFSLKKAFGLYNLASREVFSKEKSIRALASSLSFKAWSTALSIPLETLDPRLELIACGTGCIASWKILGKKNANLIRNSRFD